MWKSSPSYQITLQIVLQLVGLEIHHVPVLLLRNLNLTTAKEGYAAGIRADTSKFIVQHATENLK